MASYYQILGVSEHASQAEIKIAFKQLAVKYHPDKNQSDPGMEELFKEVNHAYQILSNPYEKARYDIKLKYGTYQPNHTPSPPRYAPGRKGGRTQYSEPKVNYRENWIATAYAWGFTFIVAIVIMGIVGIKNYFDEIKREELLAQRRLEFEDVKKLYASGQIRQSLELINGLGTFFEPEKDMAIYKDHMYDSLLLNGNTSYFDQDFKNAIFYFELIEAYAPSKPIQIKSQLATAYKETNQPYKSIKKLKELLILNYRTLDIYMSLAEIYRDQLNDLEEAKRYYEIANEQTTQNYRAVYGDAFPLIMDGKYLPSAHYFLYLNLASIYLESGDPEKAIKATKWNVRMWPDSAANYIVAGKGYLALEKKSQACQQFRIAKRLGYRGPLPINCF